jgi:hypothetical protein
MGYVIVIPTRNRADLVRHAVESIFGQSGCDVDVLVSDNSTSAEQRTDLSRYCHGMNERLRYIAPPDPLPMSQHWDWAMRQALSLYDTSHVGFLTDRMMFKPNALKPLFEIIDAYPNKILSYMHDMVDDFSRPIIVRQYAWTGNLYEVPSTRLLKLAARSAMYDSSVPRMLNCLVPRAVLDAIKDRFGNVFSSVSPDWNFAFRALETVESIIFSDKASLIHYAQRQSNGQSAQHGIVNDAYRDFMRDLKGMPPNGCAPFPEIQTVWNGIISEYCHIRQVTQSAKFPEVDLDKYAQALALGIEAIDDSQRREHMRELLSARLAKRRDAASAEVAPPSSAVIEPPHQYPPELQASQIEEFSVNAIEFQSSEDALDYALRCPRKQAVASYHEAMIHGVALRQR